MLSKSKDHNPNYLASIVKIENLRKHTNADKLKVASIFSNNVITGLSTQENDIVVFFPLESAISKEFLSYSNSFENKEMNADTSVKGYFNKAGRVRAIKLRGEKSEGYMVPVAELAAFSKNVLGKKVVFDESHVGQDFDEIFGHRLCQKYVVPVKAAASGKKKTKGSLKKYVSKLVEGQFHLHYDTEHLKRNMHKVSPDDYISITNKVHGTSFVVSHVLVKKKLNVFQKFGKLLGFNILDTEYGMLYSSRCVIKNSNFETNTNGGFYKEDLWKLVADKLFPLMKEGISVYGEMVGYTPSGGWIQKEYDYGCNPHEFDYYIYRVTYTSSAGDVYEFSDSQMREWCNKHGVKSVELYYYGKAKDLYPDLDTSEHWHDDYLVNLINDYLEKDCHICKNVVPDEGIVLRKDSVHDFEAFKLKSFKFLERETKELDAGVVDIESSQVTLSEEN